MEFVKKIRENLRLNPYQMGKKMNLEPVQRYIAFENSKKAINVKFLVRLWSVSGLSAKAFLEMIEAEVSEE